MIQFSTVLTIESDDSWPETRFPSSDYHLLLSIAGRDKETDTIPESHVIVQNARQRHIAAPNSSEKVSILVKRLALLINLLLPLHSLVLFGFA